MNLILLQKNALRSHMLNLRMNIPPQIRYVADLKIIATIRMSEFYRVADRVLLYAAIKNEVNLAPLADAAISDGKTVCYPRCEDAGVMNFHVVTSPHQLSPGKHGILEPVALYPVITPGSGDLCIVPGVAYDDSGHRLGYGGGYYDRFLDKYPDVERMGAFYAVQKVDSLPYDNHDVRMNIIVTE